MGTRNSVEITPKTGKGVSKVKKEKRALFIFADLFKRKFWKLVELNLIYILFCLPIVTFGPATAAMTKMLRYFYTEKPVFLFSDFFKAFKESFKQSFLVGIFDILFIISFCLYTIQLLPRVEGTDWAWFYYALVLLVSVIFIIGNFYIYVQIVTLTLKMPAIIKNAFYLIFLAIIPNFISLTVFVIMATLTLLFIPYSLAVLILIGFSFLGLVVVFNSYRVVVKIIVNPYYEARGEKNPEDAKFESHTAVFTDMGEEEKPEEPVFTGKAKGKGKVIK